MLKIGSFGEEVKRWQIFLTSRYISLGKADGIFGKATQSATKEFQKSMKLTVDGIVGPNTVAAAISLGYSQPAPVLKALTFADKQRLFGPLVYASDPKPGNPEAVKITNSWTKNLSNVYLSQIKGIKGAPADCTVLFHEKGADKLMKLWSRWEQEGLIHLVKTWDGAWAPRFVRGSKTTLSSHAFATAFDINAKWNFLGSAPAPSGKDGSVIDLVPIANELGFFWGGNFPTRPDGMHFELAVIQ